MYVCLAVLASQAYSLAWHVPRLGTISLDFFTVSALKALLCECSCRADHICHLVSTRACLEQYQPSGLASRGGAPAHRTGAVGQLDLNIQWPDSQSTHVMWIVAQ